MGTKLQSFSQISFMLVIYCVLGENYEYGPSAIEKGVTIGIWAIGALFFTLPLKFALPVYTGQLRFKSPDTVPGKGEHTLAE